MRLAAILVALWAGAASAGPMWLDTARSVDDRAAALLAALTPAEKRGLLIGRFAIGFGAPKPAGTVGSAGFVPGVPRLGIPPLQESDASLGITNPLNVRPGDTAVALPSGLATAASFDPAVAYANGALLGREAASRGLNVVLGPGLNLTREARGGRNFEYLGEDPLLAGTLAGEIARGIGDQHVIAVAKHFAVNDQESGRQLVNVRMSPEVLRESDLLAFEIALQRGHPGAVMCSYNKVNGAYACGNFPLLSFALKRDFAFPGFVMSDWGAVHAVDDLTAGLDQESAAELDAQPFFAGPLDKALAAGTVSQARVDDAARRILRSMIAAGFFEPHNKPAADVKGDLKVAQRAATEGIVLLANKDGVLPLAANLPCLVVTGANSDAGVPAGGGSSQVTPIGGVAREISLGGEGLAGFFRQQAYDPPAPLARLQARLPHTKILWADGRYPAQAALLAQFCPAAIVFTQQWSGEDSDMPDLALPSGQDELIEAVAKANPHTVVVLQTAGPVLMPWLNNVAGVMEAWYGGNGGADATVAVLFGDAVPSGRLPMTFPQRRQDAPRQVISGEYLPAGTKFDVDYKEGANAGYRWYAASGTKPLFPFGYGLSTTNFAYSNLTVTGGKDLTVAFDVKNTGTRAGVDVPQLYLTERGGTKLLRLLGFQRTALAAGDTAHVTLTADRRLLADFSPLEDHWRIKAGPVRIALGANEADLPLSAATELDEQVLAP